MSYSAAVSCDAMTERYDEQIVSRISAEQKAWLLARAERIRREEGRNASISDVVRLLIDEARAAESRPRPRKIR